MSAVAAAAFQVRRERVLRVLAVVGSHHHRRKVGPGVDDLREGIGSLHLEILRESLGELDEAAVVDGVRAAVEQADAAECRIRAARVAQISDRRAVGEAALLRNRRQEIDIAGAAQMLAAHAEVAGGHGVIASERVLDVQAPLPGQRLHVILGEHVNIGRAIQCRRRRRGCPDTPAGWR